MCSLRNTHSHSVFTPYKSACHVSLPVGMVITLTHFMFKLQL